MLCWKREVKIEQILSHPKYIDVKIVEGPNKTWRFTGIYGEPRWEDKYKTWDRIRELKNNSSLPWIILGDFNEILFSHEKDGGNPRPQGYMQAFRDTLSDCALEDIGFSGDQFTWKRRRIRERLDRAVADGAWSLMHPGANLRHLEYTRSDHRPILLDTDYQGNQNQGHNGPNRFEAKWLQEEGFKEEVEKAWAAASTVPGGVLGRLSHMHAALHAWDKRVLKKPKRRLRSAQRELDAALSGPITDESEKKAKEKANLIEILLE
jgi:hypothetical protein